MRKERTLKIRVTQTPPGCDPENIRSALIGIEIRIITQQDVERMPPGTWIGPASDSIHFRVSVLDLIEISRVAGKETVARYWELHYKANSRLSLAINREYCTVIEK